jgi:hypothetical protein
MTVTLLSSLPADGSVAVEPLWQEPARAPSAAPAPVQQSWTPPPPAAAPQPEREEKPPMIQPAAPEPEPSTRPLRTIEAALPEPDLLPELRVDDERPLPEAPSESLAEMPEVFEDEEEVPEPEPEPEPAPPPPPPPRVLLPKKKIAAPVEVKPVEKLVAKQEVLQFESVTQVLEQCPTGVREVMLHRISEREEGAAGAFQAVAERDQLLPAVHGDQPVELQIARQFFDAWRGGVTLRLDGVSPYLCEAEIGHVAIRPDEGVERLNVANGGAVLLAAVNLHRPGVAHLDRDDARGFVCAEEKLVVLKTHSKRFLDFARNDKRTMRAVGSEPNSIVFSAKRIR